MISDALQYLNTLEVSQDTVPTDPMNNGPPYYFQTGKSALRVIMTALLARVGYIGGDRPIRTALDFGSGYGRGTRWMRAAFPDARITVSDLNAEAAKWCVDHLSCHANNDPLTARKYDLVFLGSVFTHLPQDAIVSWFDKLVEALNPNGVLVFTAMGRFGRIHAMAEPEARINREIDREQMLAAFESLSTTGFGFVPNKKTPEYGSAWTLPQWYFDRFNNRADVVNIMFQEKAWDNFQDAYAYLKAPIVEKARSRI